MRKFIKKIAVFLKKAMAFAKKRYKLCIILALIIATVLGTYSYMRSKKASSSTTLTQYTVQKRNISVSITGTGAVTSSTKQSISSNVAGTVTGVYFKENDKVKQGDLLFQLDDNEAALAVARTRLSIQTSQSDLNTARQNIRNLSVTSPQSGVISNLSVNSGDSVNKGQEICTVIDTDHLKLSAPFSASTVKNISVGEDAVIYLQDYMDTVRGKITYVSSTPEITGGGGSTYDVEVNFDNPGAIVAGSKASINVNGISSLDNGSIAYINSNKIRAEVSGTVNSINARNGEKISNGSQILSLVNDDLNNQLLAAQIKLQDLNAQLDSNIKSQNQYKIYALFDGTIIQQTLKVGDVVKANDVLAIISNPDAMEFSISVDELDIAKITTGLATTITLDALPNERFQGVVSAVSQVGTTSSGVTTYPVTVVITNPKDIKEGMNANAEIIIEQKDNVLALPIAAVQKNRNRSFVYVKGTAGTSNTSNTPNTSSTQSNGTGSQAAFMKTNGLTMKEVQTGINNDNFIEITGGLNDGDIVVGVTKTSTTTTTSNQGGFGGPGMGGGFMAGGTNANRTSGTSSSRTSSSSSSSSSSSRSFEGGGSRGD